MSFRERYLLEERFFIKWNPFAKKNRQNSLSNAEFIEPGNVNHNFVKKYEKAILDFFHRHGWDNKPEDVIGDEVAISLLGNKIVAIWEFQYSSTHCYLNPFGIDKDIKNIAKIINPMVEWLRTETYPEDAAEIYIPKEYKAQASRIKSVKVNDISRYEGNITLEVQKDNK